MLIATALWSIALLVVLGRYGGGNDAPATIAAGAGLLAAATFIASAGLRGHHRVPALWPLLLLFVPAALWAAAQAAPLGWVHPWVASAVDESHATRAWSLDPQASWTSAAWLLALGLAAVLAALAGRGRRAWLLASALVAIAAAHAVGGIILALAMPDWPSTSAAGRVRGSFVYPNHAAVFWGACLPLALQIAATARQRRWWFAVAALALGVLLSASRGGIAVTALVCLPLAWTLLPERRRGWYALALGIGLAGYLALLGLDLTRARFGQLIEGNAISAEGLSLNGRLDVWRHTLPLIADATPVGSGAGTTRLAFLRAGATAFADSQVDMLHCDPLQWTLEAGWLGAAVIFGTASWALWALRPRPMPEPPAGDRDARAEFRRRRALRRGVWCGVAVLGLHCCVDFTWHSPAIALLGATLAGLAASLRHAPATAGSGVMTAPRRVVLHIGLAGGGLLLAGSLVWWWPWALNNERAFTGSAYLYGRIARQQPWSAESPALAGIAPRTVDAALLIARLNLALPPSDATLARAERALNHAASCAPGHPEIWIERARLAIARNDPDQNRAVTAAVARALAWAPASPYVQLHAVWCLAHLTSDRHAQEQAAVLTARLLATDLTRPAWFFPVAAAVAGDDAVASALADPHHPRLSASGLGWLAARGDLTAWRSAQARRLKHAPVATLAQWFALRDLYPEAIGDPATRLTMPDTADRRATLAGQLAAAGLPLPPTLTTALAADGSPWNLWASGDPLAGDAAARTARLAVLDRHLWRGWARDLRHLHARLTQAERGATADLGRDDDPRVIACARMHADLGLSERSRLDALAEAWRTPTWTTLPGARWTWLQTSDDADIRVHLATWTGLVIDGAWCGWRRGRCDLAAGLPAGIHRIALIEAP